MDTIEFLQKHVSDETAWKNIRVVFFHTLALFITGVATGFWVIRVLLWLADPQVVVGEFFDVLAVLAGVLSVIGCGYALFVMSQAFTAYIALSYIEESCIELEPTKGAGNVLLFRKRRPPK